MITSVDIGDKIRFKPACWMDMKTEDGRGGQNRIEAGSEVTGTVDYINREHNWFRVRYEVRGIEQHECFPLPQEASPPPEGRKKRDGKHTGINC